MAPVQIGLSDFRFFDIMRHVNNCYYAESKRWFRFGMKWRGLLRRNPGDAAFFDGFFCVAGAVVPWRTGGFGQCGVR